MTIKKPGVLPAFSFLPVIMLILFDRWGDRLLERGTIPGIIGSELLLLLFAGILYLLFFKKRPIRWKIRGDYFMLTLLSVILLYPGMMFLNGMFLRFLSGHTPMATPPVELLSHGMPLGKAILLFALLPGICEEVFFRGIIQGGYRDISPWWSVAIGAFYFALSHFSLQQLVSPFLLGILLGVIVLRTGHAGYAMVAHTVHNLIGILVLRYLTPEKIRILGEKFPSAQVGSVQNGIFSFLFVMGIGGAILFFLLYRKWDGPGPVEIKRKKETGSILISFGAAVLFMVYYGITVG